MQGKSRECVVFISHVGWCGTVPEKLLEDERLSLNARAVGAWLSIRPLGWKISISLLRAALGVQNKPLGTDKWLRLARELEAAGYFSRVKRNGPDGKWDWQITFIADPSASTSEV